MDFLKEILKDKYQEFCDILAEYNKKNPEKAVKLADLSKGEYIEKGKYDALSEKYYTDTKKLDETIKKNKFDYALELMLKSSGSKNTKALKALLDMDKLSEKDGVISGLDEQLAKLKKSDAYLFESADVPKFVRPVSGGGELTREDFKKLSYMERLKLKKEAPHLFSKLK